MKKLVLSFELQNISNGELWDKEPPVRIEVEMDEEEYYRLKNLLDTYPLYEVSIDRAWTEDK